MCCAAKSVRTSDAVRATSIFLATCTTIFRRQCDCNHYLHDESEYDLEFLVPPLISFLAGSATTARYSIVHMIYADKPGT